MYIFKARSNAPRAARGKLCGSQCELDSPALWTHAHLLVCRQRRWTSRRSHRLLFFLQCTPGPENLHRLPLHTGEPGHAEGIHTLLSFTTCAFVGPGLLLPPWLRPPLWSEPLSVDWRWERNLGFSLTHVNAAHIAAHVAWSVNPRWRHPEGRSSGSTWDRCHYHYQQSNNQAGNKRTHLDYSNYTRGYITPIHRYFFHGMTIYCGFTFYYAPHRFADQHLTSEWSVHKMKWKQITEHGFNENVSFPEEIKWFYILGAFEKSEQDVGACELWLEQIPKIGSHGQLVPCLSVFTEKERILGHRVWAPTNVVIRNTGR